MSFDAFLFFDTIRGESLDEQNEDSIELLSYNFGMHNPGKISASTAGGASTGRVEVSSFTLTKLIDVASCKLLEASCSGQHF
jgi:type VI protein secretion system component Hcp